MSLTDGAWQILDAPVIKEIERSTRSFYTVNTFSRIKSTSYLEFRFL